MQSCNIKQTSPSWHVITIKTVCKGHPHIHERQGEWQMRRLSGVKIEYMYFCLHRRPHSCICMGHPKVCACVRVSTVFNRSVVFPNKAWLWRVSVAWWRTMGFLYYFWIRLMLLFHGNWCVFWIATFVGLGHDTDKIKERGPWGLIFWIGIWQK